MVDMAMELRPRNELTPVFIMPDATERPLAVAGSTGMLRAQKENPCDIFATDR
jgi:hypothetical protein